MPSSTTASSTDFSLWLQRQWRHFGPWQLVLFPLSCLFYLITLVRRLLFGFHLLPGWRLPVPVIIVGNITVGGTGKTPLVLWLVAFLRAHGYRPGVISRGYGSRASEVQSVSGSSDPMLVGDEPLLIAKRMQCPVWVGRRRGEVARALLAARPDCDVLISDDGLQHYALQRDVEIAVIDGERRFGNSLLLPAGPLREPLSRLHELDALVCNGGAAQPGEFGMQLRGHTFRRLSTGETATPDFFAGMRLHALAGIGHPARFFDYLRGLGMRVVEHAFPDHHAFQPHELQFDNADAILMTEKDAVKCAAFAPPKAWALAVDAEVDAAFGELVLQKLRTRHGHQTA